MNLVLPEMLVAPRAPSWLMSFRSVGTVPACPPFEPWQHLLPNELPSGVWDGVRLQRIPLSSPSPHLFPPEGPASEAAWRAGRKNRALELEPLGSNPPSSNLTLRK